MAAAARSVPCLMATCAATLIRAEVGAPLPLPPSLSPSPRGFCTQLGQLASLASGLRIRHARVEPHAWPAFRVQRPGPEFKRIRMSSGQASPEPRHMTGNVQSAEHEALARHTATQGPMQGAEERRELRDASCSEHAHVGLAEPRALTVIDCNEPPVLGSKHYVLWIGHGSLPPDAE